MVDVNHDQVEAMTMADRIVVLRDGRIERAGPPVEIHARPALPDPLRAPVRRPGLP